MRRLDEIEDRPQPWRRLHIFAHSHKISEYPWAAMQVGDAFRFGLVTEGSARHVARRASARLRRSFAVVKMGVKLYCFRVENIESDSTEWRDKVKGMRETKYPWRTLEVGRSFKWDEDVLPHSRRTMAKAASERYGKVFEVQGNNCRRIK